MEENQEGVDGVEENPLPRCLKGVISWEGWTRALRGGGWICLIVTWFFLIQSLPNLLCLGIGAKRRVG